MDINSPHHLFGAVVIKKLLIGDHVNGHRGLLKSPWNVIADSVMACPFNATERQAAFKVAVDGIEDGDAVFRSVVLADPKQDLDTLVKEILWDIDFYPMSVIQEALHREEAGDADLFASMFTNRVLFDHMEKSWYLWGGNFWQSDKTGTVKNLVSDKVAAQYLHAATLLREAGAEHKVVDKFYERSKALCFRRRIDNVLCLAQSKYEIAISGIEWEQNTTLLPVKNGVIDLTSGALLNGNPKDYLRKHVPIVWQGLNQATPQWERYLADIRNDNQEEVSFLRRLLGSSILGTTVKKCFPVFYGPGGDNGKTTFAEVICNLLGEDFAYSIPPEVVMKTDIGNSSGQANSYLFNLRGKRFVCIAENTKEQVLDIALVKRLTGGDRITTRNVYSSAVTFKPTHTLFLMTNDRPKIIGHDDAIWSRLCLIPFDVKFVDNPIGSFERKKIGNIQELLKQEYPGILAWMVRGALEFQATGLSIPKHIQAFGNEYRGEQDSIQAFLESECLASPTMNTKSSLLYQEYAKYCVANDVAPISQTQFGIEIGKKFQKRRSDGVQIMGLGLKSKAVEH